MSRLVRYGWEDNMEEWRDITDYEGVYQISNLGRARSLDRPSGAYRKGRVLRAATSKLGYKYIILCRGGFRKLAKLHRLVAAAWHGPCPKGKECAHLDGSKDNNVPENLKWVSHKENMEHTAIHGVNRVFIGVANKMAKITEADVLEIRQRWLDGESHRDIARHYSIGKSSVCNITIRKTWDHI